MADEVKPTIKPTEKATTTNGGDANPALPDNRPKRTRPMNQPLPPPPRPKYWPVQPPPPRRRRSCCCSCYLWTTSIIILILVLAAIAGAILYLLYRPQSPNFSVSSLQLSQFNLTTTTVTSKFNITITARNPNDHMKFFYDPISISISSENADIGDGSFPGFVHGTKNTTVLKSVLSSPIQPIEGSDMVKLRSKKSLVLKIQLDANVKVEVQSVKSKKFSIKVTCTGLQINVPTGKFATTATTSQVKCKVDPGFKILNWTI